MKALAGRIRGNIPRMEAAVQFAAEAAALKTAETARAFAPVDSGELRSGIEACKTGDGAAVVSTAPHAAMVEYGTSRMAPQPYLLPAVQLAGTQFFEGMCAAAKGVLE